MIKIKIAEIEMDITNRRIDEQWIHQQIERRKRDGLSVCVTVTILENGVNLFFFTPTCNFSNIGGKGNSLSSKETKIIELWDNHGLQKKDFSGGAVIAFIKQLCHILDH